MVATLVLGIGFVTIPMGCQTPRRKPEPPVSRQSSTSLTTTGSTAPLTSQLPADERSGSGSNDGPNLTSLCELDPNSCPQLTEEQIAGCRCNVETGRRRQKCLVDCTNRVRTGKPLLGGPSLLRD